MSGGIAMKDLHRMLPIALVLLFTAAVAFAGGGQEEPGTGTGIPTYTWEVTGPGDAYERGDLMYYDEWKEALNTKLEKDLGFRVDFVDKRIRGEFRNVYRIAYESGEGIDVVYDGDYNSNIGMWMPLNDLLNEHGPNIKKYFSDEFFWYAVMDGDDIMGIPHYWGPDRYVVWVRKDLAEDAGVTIPDIDDRDGITLDWWENLFEAFVQKNPGKYAYQGMAWTWGQFVYNHYIGTGYCYNKPYYFDIENQTFHHIFDHPAFYDAAWRRKSWFDNGWEDPNTYAKSRAERTMDLVEGFNVAHPQKYDYTAKEPVLGYIRAHPGFEENMEPVLFGVENHGVRACTNRFVKQGLFFMKHANDPEQLMQFFNWYFGDPENTMLAKHGIEGLTFEIVEEPAGKILTVPEEVRTDLIQSPRDLIGQEINFHRWAGLDEQFLRATYNEPYLRGRRLQTIVPLDEIFWDPYHLDLAPDWTTEVQTQWNDANQYMFIALQKLYLEKMSRAQFEEQLGAAIQEARKIGLDAGLASFNRSIKRINHRYE
jgi:hypothetical protein